MEQKFLEEKANDVVIREVFRTHWNILDGENFL